MTLLARQLRKLVIPIFIRPSFERHEVERRRYDEALAVARQLDVAQVRFIEILNDRGYLDSHPQSQSAVWERMNVPVARALRGLLYVLSDLSQVDPSDLSALFAGHGRLRIGFSELDPAPGTDPGDDEVQTAVERCWDNRFCNFREPVGTSLICIQGQWSNVADAKIKGLLAAQASASESAPYNPLYARAFHTPKPWGVTALFAEHTGNHNAVEIDWPLEQTWKESAQDAVVEPEQPPTELDGVPSGERDSVVQIHCVDVVDFPSVEVQPHRGPEIVDSFDQATAIDSFPTERACEKARTYESFWDLALAMNRSEPAALAVAENGADATIAVDPMELKKLLGTVWFRAVFHRLSAAWRERLLDVIVEHVVVPNHRLRLGRRDVPLREINHAELKELFSKSSISEAVRTDIYLLMAVGSLWGAESLARFQFADDAYPPDMASKLSWMGWGR